MWPLSPCSLQRTSHLDGIIPVFTSAPEANTHVFFFGTVRSASRPSVQRDSQQGHRCDQEPENSCLDVTRAWELMGWGRGMVLSAGALPLAPDPAAEPQQLSLASTMWVPMGLSIYLSKNSSHS